MAEFEGIVNRTVHDQHPSPFVQIKHQGSLHKVRILTLGDLHAAKQLDDAVFGTHQGISHTELDAISKKGRVLGVFDGGELVGESQLLLEPISDHPNLTNGEAYCYGTGVREDHRGSGVAQVLFKAQEVTSREAGKEFMSLTVRLENAASIRARLASGFRVTGYDPNRYDSLEADGTRLIMVKDFLSEPTPYAPNKLRQRALTGNIPILGETSPSEQDVIQLGLPVLTGDTPDLAAHAFVPELLSSGFVGVGLLKPEEWNAQEKSLIIFHQKNEPFPKDIPHDKPYIENEFGNLKEVLVSYGVLNSQVYTTTAINSVAEKNIGNVDPIARQEEYLDFLKTLGEQGIKIIQTHAQVPEVGKSPVFTRDPSFVIGDTVVIGRLGREQRQYETNALKEIFEDAKHMDLSGNPDAVTEGGDIIQIDSKSVLVGIGQRTNRNGFNLLQSSFPGMDFIPVSHPDLHLDVLFTMLGKNMALADTTQLPSDFVQTIESRGIQIITADPSEQQTLGCNVLAISDRVVVSVAENVETNRRLEESGVKVIKVSMPNIIKSGGGPRCMSCPIRRE